MIATVIFSVLAITLAMAKLVRTPEPDQIATQRELRVVRRELEARLPPEPIIVTTGAASASSIDDRPTDMASRAVQLQILKAIDNNKRDIARLQAEIRRLTAVHERAPE